MRDIQFHRPPKKLNDLRSELPAGKELETRAESPVSDEDADELPHDRFGILHELGETAPDLLQGRQREFRPDPGPRLIADRLGVHSSSVDSSTSLMLSSTQCVDSGSRRSVTVRSAE